MPAAFPSSRLSHLLASSSVSVLLLAGVLATPVQAAETIIVNGQSVAQQTLIPGDVLTVNAGGVVDGAAADAVVDTAAGTVTVTNQGTIKSTLSAIKVSNSSLIVDNGGTITGGGDGLSASTITSLKNSGDIAALSFAANALDVGTVVNSGTITGSKAFNIFGALGLGSLVNTGTITGTGLSAIEVGTTIGTVDNSKDILGQTSGIYAGGTIGTITNSGTITGTTNYGVYAGGAIGAVDNKVGGTILGQLSGVISVGTIATLTNGGTITGTTRFGAFTNGDIGSIANTGTITGNMGGIDALGKISDLDNSGTISGTAGVGVAASIAITKLSNSGTISAAGGSAAVYSFGTLGALTNSGAIQGGVGIIANSSIDSISNGGDITGTVGNGVYAGGAIGSVDNKAGGNISAALSGIYAGAIATLTNGGTITGADGGIVVAQSIGSIINSGTISDLAPAQHYGAIVVQSLGKLINTSTGKIIATGINSAIKVKDIGSIENAGYLFGYSGISDSNDVGIDSLTNNGTIAGTLDGISAETIGTINNSGTIEGQTDLGIFGHTGIGTITNSGVIKGQHSGVYLYSGTLGKIDNTGTISSSGGTAVVAFGDVGSIVNAGAISGGGDGVYSSKTIGRVTNSGTILGSGSGILTDGTIGSVTNGGRISGGQFGIKSAGLLALTNSGTIAGATPADFAIVESKPALATDTVLNLNAGSILIGHVDIHGGNNTLNVGRGLNLALTFDASVPEAINAGSSTVVVVGNTVYVADASTLASAGDATANLSAGVAGLAAGALDKGFDEKGIDGSGHYWLEALGGVGSSPGKNGGPAIRDGFVGFAVGADFGPDADTRFGGFVGAARGIVDNGAETSASDNFYAGIYAGAQFDDFSLKGTLSAGNSHGSGSRVVANNTVATGLENITGSGDAYFVSPGIVLTKPWTTPDMTFETSLALNYTGVFAGAYSESSAVGLNLDAATTHMFAATGLVKLPMQMQNENGLISGDLHAGIEARATINPDLTGTLAGKPVSLASANVATTAGLLAGGALAFELDGGVTLFGSLDATLRSDDSASAVANVGFKGRF